MIVAMGSSPTRDRIGELWISHQKAEIIVAARHQENVSQLWSQATSGAEVRFYNQIIDRIQDASSLLIFGPDEAKSELLLRLELLSPKRHF